MTTLTKVLVVDKSGVTIHRLPEFAVRWEIHEDSHGTQFMAVSDYGTIMKIVKYPTGELCRWEAT